MTRGYGIINHTFEEFRPRVKAQIGGRRNGALIQWIEDKQQPMPSLVRGQRCKLHGTRY